MLRFTLNDLPVHFDRLLAIKIELKDKLLYSLLCEEFVEFNKIKNYKLNYYLVT